MVRRDAAWRAAARKAKLLSWLSLGYMTAEGAVPLLAAVLASPFALPGFGLDSAIGGLARRGARLLPKPVLHR